MVTEVQKIHILPPPFWAAHSLMRTPVLESRSFIFCQRPLLLSQAASLVEYLHTDNHFLSLLIRVHFSIYIHSYILLWVNQLIPLYLLFRVRVDKNLFFFPNGFTFGAKKKLMQILKCVCSSYIVFTSQMSSSSPRLGGLY